jgi:murein DD-endopeptidase MepM/ murein hydrolase activator NlpD
VAFALGGLTGWWIHKTMSLRALETVSTAAPSIEPSMAPSPLSEVQATDTPDSAPVIIPRARDPVDDSTGELRHRALRLPVDGADVATMKGGFASPRKGEPRGHEAVDLLAPRHTPVHAVEDGKIARLYFSKAGGTTIYQFDPSERFCYYYAHLDRYADGVEEGQLVARGQVIGYVGTTGNAPLNTPHLHFAIFKLGDDKQWWRGTPLDPYLVFRP